MTHEQKVRARVAARELRLGTSWNFAPVVSAVLQLHQALLQRDAPLVPGFDAMSELRQFLEQRVEELELALQAGRLLVVDGAFPLLAIPPEPELVFRDPPPSIEPVPPPIARRRPDDKLTFFEVRFVDEIGEAIGGFEVELKAGSAVENVQTNPAGVATLDDVPSMSGSVSVVDVDELGKIVEPRWETERAGSPPATSNTTSIPFTGAAIRGVLLKPAVPNTVVIVPPVGNLFVELWDKTGRVRHVEQRYSITGPKSFEGQTDQLGQLLHEAVPRGDYELSLTVEVEGANGEKLQNTYRSPLVVLDAAETAPQVRMLGVVPIVIMARMRGMLFDTNKCFLLPTSLEALQEIRQIYEAYNHSELLIVGHTDKTAEPDINDPLSVERAKSMKAYLEDDVDAWLGNYDLAGKKQWGSREDRLMIAAMPDFDTREADEDIVVWFQRTRGLTVDGKAGKQTRTQLIKEYMALDGVDFGEEPDFQVNIQTHGAGENFPLKDTGFELDQQAVDEQEDPFDRRVELFFFDPDFKVLPAPGAPDGEEYLEWRKRAAQNKDFPIEGIGKKATVIEMEDALFRTNSCVLLPEGEAPSSDDHQAITSVGLTATVLRFSEQHQSKQLFVAGHADTTGSDDFNVKLSLERARCALAVIEGARDTFVDLADKRHTVGDYKQILSWCSKAFEDVVFDCDPGSIDDNAATGVEPVRRFQAAYNANKEVLGVTSDIAVDGDVGKETWGAFFDVYEFGLRQELGEDEGAVAALRDKLLFVDDERKALGFGEYHPVDQVGRDNARSQQNRRVEVFFFDEGEEPDLVLAESDPDISELYLPSAYRHTTVPPLLSAKRSLFELRVLDFDLDGVPDTECRVTMGDEEQVATSDADGVVKLRRSNFHGTCDLRWRLPSGAETVREGVVVELDSGDEAVGQRLSNLGHDHDVLEDRVRAHQLEFGREPTGQLADVADEIIKWHDTGLKPTAGSNLIAAPSNVGAKRQLANVKTAGPNTQPIVLTPECVYQEIRSGKRLIGVKIPCGCHMGVSFPDADRSKPVEVNTSPNAIDFRDRDVFLEGDASPGRRVFFHAKKLLPQSATDRAKQDPNRSVKENPLFLQGQRVIFQVEVHETKFPDRRRNVLLLKLFGSTLALNAHDMGSAFMWKGTPRGLLVPRSQSLTEMLDGVLAQMAEFGGKLDHLVINGHGRGSLQFNGLFVDIGTGITRNNVQVWKRISGRVRYIWFQNCGVGTDNVLMGDIALHSQALISAPAAGAVGAAFPKFHIELPRQFKHFDGRGTSSAPAPMKADDFFRLGRRNKNFTTDVSALDFNVVAQPKGPLEPKSPGPPGGLLP